MLCTKHRQQENLRLLLEAAADPNVVVDGGWTALLFCAKYGSAFDMEMLLKHGGKINVQNSQGWTALMLTIKYGGLRKLKQLLTYGANPNLCAVNGMTAAHFCVKYGRPAYLKMLVEDPGQYALQQRKEVADLIFNCAGMPTYLCLLLACFVIGNVNVDLRDRHGRVPLDMVSVLVKSPEISTPDSLRKLRRWENVEKILADISSLDV